jgi:anti-anti-sigma regulatory factor
MPVILKQSEALNQIRLEGVVDIASAAELKELLVNVFKAGKSEAGDSETDKPVADKSELSKEVRISVEAVTDLDVTAVQLLWAAEREARGSGVVFKLADAVPESVSAALGEAGFLEFPVPVDAKDANVDTK